jgi:hypothetical protein
VNLATGGGQLFRKLTIFLVAAVPVLLLLGLVRAIALLRRGTGATWRDAMGAFFIWQSTSLVVARASVVALFAKQAAFLRTPKTSERTSWLHALRANWAETILALCGVAGIAGGLTKWSTLGGPLLAGLLFVPTLGMAAAPFNSWAARRAALPAYLRQRRATEYRRDRSFAAGVSTGGAIAVGLIAAAAIALMLTGHLIHAPSLVQPIQPPATTATTPAPSATPTQRPTATQSSTPAATPSSTPPTPTPSSTPTPTQSSTPTATPTTATPTATAPTTPPASSSAPATSNPRASAPATP